MRQPGLTVVLAICACTIGVVRGFQAAPLHSTRGFRSSSRQSPPPGRAEAGVAWHRGPTAGGMHHRERSRVQTGILGLQAADRKGGWLGGRGDEGRGLGRDSWFQQKLSEMARKTAQMTPKLAAPRRFLRLERVGDNKFELQTAVTTYKVPGSNQTVSLISLVHLADPRYYRELEALAEGKHDRVLFELIADPSHVVQDPSTGLRHLSERLYPGGEQSVLANAHGLQAQLDAMSLLGEKWCLADLERESIYKLQAQRGESSQPSMVKALAGGWGAGDFKAFPKRLSDMIRTWLRLPIWLVPCPEGALLMLDWALSERGRLSSILGAVMDSILEFDIQTASKLSFAQLLASGSMRCEGPQTVIINERNKVAISELKKALSDGVPRTALLYGGLHGQDLDAKMREELGLIKESSDWLAAWRIMVPASRNGAAKIGFAAALYLLIDGFDWMTTISGAAEEISDGSINGALALGAAYLFRHVLAYWQLGRILVAWDTTPFDYVTSRVEGEARLEDE